ncbi:BRCA1-associated ATM activator 1 isoform X1 [Salminus brasiliensis]|uniref:BRCA1-associated ATM activator 1 isoform X1 n=1 Tax=Salminus brasiliensis TaxID=930266 RepID=UPI003B82D2B2
MECDILSLLSAVCEVLPNPKLVLPDDTSLDKLLDWLKELSQGDGQYITHCQPCLLEFLHTVTKSEAIDPTVFSFTLKLTGLLASKEDSFILLQEREVLLYMFDPDSWHKMDLWENVSVRGGWLQGMWNMLQHQQALDFFCSKGLMKLVLCLQHDESFFLASLTNQVLAHILNSIMLPVLSSHIASGVQSCPLSGEFPVKTDWASIKTEVMHHITKSLASEEQAVVISGLRLLAVTVAQCREPIKRMLWKHALEPLEVLVNLQEESLNLSIMAVLQASAKTLLFIKPECKVVALMDAMLYSRNTNESVQCAALILEVDNCPEDLKRKATNVILRPLLCVTASPLQPHLPDSCDSFLENQLSQRISCVPLLTQSLSSTTDLICKNSLDHIPIRLITSSVILLLKMCIGQHPSTFLKTATFSHLIGKICCKIQKYSLDVLRSITIYKESVDLIPEALTVLLLYLQSPDLHATVLKKSYQAILKWLGICSPSPAVWFTISQDLFPLLTKLVCDGRWEVRDSTLEFIMQLTATLKGNCKYHEAFNNSGMTSLLLTALSDVEGYVQASAVAALGETLTEKSLCPSQQEEAVTHLLTILTQGTESFPRRAVVKVFTSWLKSQLSFPALDGYLSSVLSLGSNDFDWEVKVQTLEIANMLMDNSLGCYESSQKQCIKHALYKLMDLGLFDLLLKCLFDCDRPVSQKACALLLKLKNVMRETCCADRNDLTLEISKCSWGEEMLQICDKKQCAELSSSVKTEDPDSTRKMSLFNILELLDLEDMQCILSLSSDHVINSPQSVMEDILFAAQQNENNVVDCY